MLCFRANRGLVGFSIPQCRFDLLHSAILELKKYVSASAADLVFNTPTSSILHVQHLSQHAISQQYVRMGSSEVTDSEACIKEKGITTEGFSCP